MEGDDAEEGVTAYWIFITAKRLTSILRTSPDGPEQADVRSLGWATRVAGRTEKAIDGS